MRHVRWALCSLLAAAPAAAGEPRPPTARTVDSPPLVLHGETYRDEYAWLRAGGEDRAVRAHLAAENAYADALLRPRAREIAALEREISALAFVDHDDAPVRRGEWLYWTRAERRRDHPLHLRRRVDAGPDARPQVVLDLDALARGRDFLDLGVFELSDDHRRLAYAIDTVGDENHTLYIKHLDTGSLGRERISRVTSAAWSEGGRALLYTVRDDTHRAYALRMRGEGGEDRELYVEADPRFDLQIERSRSGEWLFLTSDSYGAAEVRVARAARPEGPWTVVAPRSAGHLYDLDHAGDAFYIRSNRGAPHFRVFAAPEHDPTRWRELVPERPGVAITDLDAFREHLVLVERERGHPRLSLLDLSTGARVRAGAPEERRGAVAATQEIAAIWPGDNPEPAATHVRVHVESAHEPVRTVDVALADGGESLVDRWPLPGPCGGRARMIAAARAADGAELRIVRFAGAGAGGSPRPTLLEAYGAYGSTYDPDFDAGRCALMNRGVDFVIAWVRGGGELGEPWHDAGRARRRMVAVGDLIAVAEHLIAAGWTRPELLAVAGDSAGGGLVAAAVHARPELFAAAVLRVPFLDVIGTMSDLDAPLTTLELEEWGDPRIAEDHAVMRRWCPYSNLDARDYPAILVESSLSDGRVAYHEQARYVARLRARAPAGGPYLLRTELHAGHGGASDRRAWLRARAFEVAFLLSRISGA